MPVHDWTRVISGTFHDSHQRWIVEISRALNDGILPEGFYAMVEQIAEGLRPDVRLARCPEMLAEHHRRR